MKSGAPWSIKGIDPQARDAAKKAAARAGMTLGEFFNQFLLEGELPGMDAPQDRVHSSRPTASAADPDFNEGAIASALRDVTARLNRSEEHTISGMAEIRDSILEMSERVQGLEAAKYEAPAELRAEIDQIAESVAATRAQTEAAMDTTHGLMEHMAERLETSVEQSTEAVGTVSNAIEAMAERIDGLEAKIAAIRLEADINAAPAGTAAVEAVATVEAFDEGDDSKILTEAVVSAAEPAETEPSAEAFGTWISDTENVQEEDFGYPDDLSMDTSADEENAETSQFGSADESSFETIELSKFGTEAEVSKPADNLGIAGFEVPESVQDDLQAEPTNIPVLPDVFTPETLEAETTVETEPEPAPESAIDELLAVENSLTDLYAGDDTETTLDAAPQDTAEGTGIEAAEQPDPTADEQFLSIEQQIANVYGADAAEPISEPSVEDPVATFENDAKAAAGEQGEEVETVQATDAADINDEFSAIDEEVAALFDAEEEPAEPVEGLVPDTEAGEAFSAMEQEVNAAFQETSLSDDGTVGATETEDLGFDPFSEIDDEVAALFADEQTETTNPDVSTGDELSAAAAVQEEEVPAAEQAADDEVAPDAAADTVDYLKQEIENAFAMQDSDDNGDITDVVDIAAGADSPAVEADDFDIDQYLDNHLDTAAQATDRPDETISLVAESSTGSSVQDFLGQFDDSAQAISAPADVEPAVTVEPVGEVEPVSADAVSDNGAEWDIPAGIKPDTGATEEKPRSAEDVIAAIRKAAQGEAKRGIAAAAAAEAAALAQPEPTRVKQPIGSREGMLKFGVIGGLALIVVFSMGYLLIQLWL